MKDYYAIKIQTTHTFRTIHNERSESKNLFQRMMLNSETLRYYSKETLEPTILLR